MPQVSIVSGIYSNAIGDYRQSYPVNYYPVVLETGIANAYLRQTPGVANFAAGVGVDRGNIEFKGLMYRVSGPALLKIYQNGVVEQVGNIPGMDRVTMVKGVNQICIVADGKGFYYSETGGLQQITDPDFGFAIDVIQIDGYFLFIDQENIFNSDLNDPFAINPLSFGSAEVEGDANVGIEKIRNEAYVCGTETIEIFQNVGGAGFPFQRVGGAMIPKGIVGRYAKTNAENTLFFVGAGRGEAPSIYLAGGGQAQKIATDEIEKLIQSYTQEELEAIYCESYTANGQFFVLVHCADQTLIYDLYGSRNAGTPLWHVRKSGEDGPYRQRGFLRIWNQWIVGDLIDGRIGIVQDDLPSEYGETVYREFSTPLGFVDGNAFIIHKAVLYGLPGRTAINTNPRVAMSISRNGITYSKERWAESGARGQYNWMPIWRMVGRANSAMTLKFRVANQSFYTPNRLEVSIEVLNAP